MTSLQPMMNSGANGIGQALAAWKPWAQLPAGGATRQAIEEFLMAPTADARRAALSHGSDLFRLHNIYRELGILREDGGERGRDFATLLATPNADLHAAVRGNGAVNLLALLQQTFEFGKTALHPKYEAVRTCLLELWRTEAGGPSMKFSLYPNGIIFSAGGKTHEEMAREFVAKGYGAGIPQAGGQIFRTGTLAFNFDLSSTAFRANGIQPAAVGAGFQRWIRVTGGDESKVRFAFRPPAGSR